jgi:hypothetical protein
VTSRRSRINADTGVKIAAAASDGKLNYVQVRRAHGRTPNHRGFPWQWSSATAGFGGIELTTGTTHRFGLAPRGKWANIPADSEVIRKSRKMAAIE